MIELAFIACLGTAPAACEDRAMLFTDMTVAACLSGAQPQLARWASEHPRWRIRRWSCRPAGREHDA